MMISKNDRPIGRLRRMAALGGVLFAALAAAPPPGPAPLSMALKAEKLTAAADSPLPAFETLELAFRGEGRYAPRLLPEASPLALPELDLRLLVPRIPRLARDNADLTRIALIQREFNRNEVHNDLGGGLDFSVANNCLRQSLWEVKLAR